MSRSGYDEGECENVELYRHAVDLALHGRRGQAFLRELAAALDAMPEKALIAGELIDEHGGVCAIGAVCQARKLDVSKVDCYCAQSVAKMIGVAWSMAAEIAYMNDEYLRREESPAQRWQRMRQWVAEQITTKGTT